MGSVSTAFTVRNTVTNGLLSVDYADLHEHLPHLCYKMTQMQLGLTKPHQKKLKREVPNYLGYLGFDSTLSLFDRALYIYFIYFDRLSINLIGSLY
jgi:hypothetical protein